MNDIELNSIKDILLKRDSIQQESEFCRSKDKLNDYNKQESLKPHKDTQLHKKFFERNNIKNQKFGRNKKMRNIEYELLTTSNEAMVKQIIYCKIGSLAYSGLL